VSRHGRGPPPRPCSRQARIRICGVQYLIGPGGDEACSSSCIFNKTSRIEPFVNF
jgi:hypothetical protein